MCLDVVTKRYLIPRGEEFTAYKMFRVGRHPYTAHEDVPLFSPQRYNFWPLASWVKASGWKDEHGFFRTGFYCYAAPPPRWESTSYLPIIPIRVRGLVTKGCLNHDEIVIVREMFIPVNWREVALHVMPPPPNERTQAEKDAAIEEILTTI